MTLRGVHPERPARAVLLRHVLPDGSEHFDWLFERATGSRLIAFRVSDRLDVGDPASLLAERIADHRAEYLIYEGPVSENRGHVQRVATGQSLLRLETDRVLTVDQNWGRGWWRWTGEPAGQGAIWRFLSTRLGWQDDAGAGML